MIPAYHEEHHGTPLFPLQVYSQKDSDGFYSVSQHWHEELEWIYMEYGTLNVTIHGRSFLLNPGEFCFINSGELHELRSRGESGHHAIVFHPGFLDFALYDACQHHVIRPITGKAWQFPAHASALPPEYQEPIRSHLREIIRLYHTPAACVFLSMKLHLFHVIELLFTADAFLKDPRPQRGKDSLDKLKQVIEYIHQNYANPISLSTLSGICFMSPNYFCRFFKQEIGKTPVTFLNEYRIEKACTMLTGSDRSVSEIALLVGFDNFSYFIRKFRDYKGVTPRGYRQTGGK